VGGVGGGGGGGNCGCSVYKQIDIHANVKYAHELLWFVWQVLSIASLCAYRAACTLLLQHYLENTF
jgi:hypothetical protein